MFTDQLAEIKKVLGEYRGELSNIIMRL